MESTERVKVRRAVKTISSKKDLDRRMMDGEYEKKGMKSLSPRESKKTMRFEILKNSEPKEGS